MTYTRETIRKIKRGADSKSVNHILPRAYCVAKPAPCLAVLAVPPCDREEQIRLDPWQRWATVQNESCLDIQHGDWASLAYTANECVGEMRVIHKL